MCLESCIKGRVLNSHSKLMAKASLPTCTIIKFHSVFSVCIPSCYTVLGYLIASFDCLRIVSFSLRLQLVECACTLYNTLQGKSSELLDS